VVADEAHVRALGDKWDAWTQCGTARASRMLPAGARPPLAALGRGAAGSLPQQIVFELFGACGFGAKRTLFTGFVAALGRAEAVKYLPETWFSEGAREAGEYARTHPDARFILKTGHRQEHVDIVPATDVAALVDKASRASVTQVLMPTVTVGAARTAFRTYTWLRCSGANREPSALVDWMSPAYHAVDNQTMIASGYTGAKDIATASELVSRHMTREQGRDVRACVRRTVAQFLRVFGARMCEFPDGPDPPRAGAGDVFERALVAEVYGFDWIPILVEPRAGAGRAGCRLLETNRFPDMQLSGSADEPTPKDELKICTYLRRFAVHTPEAARLGCDEHRDEDVVFPSDATAGPRDGDGHDFHFEERLVETMINS